MKDIKKIFLTTGDSDGIGLEVTYKALARLGPQHGFQFILFRAKDGYPKTNGLIRKKFDVHRFACWDDACENLPVSSRAVVEILSKASAAHWVEIAASACLEGRASALVTAPLSKQLIISSGLKDLGHTDILKRLSNKNLAFMGFCGKHFNVVLATGHIPLSAVSAAANTKQLEAAVLAALEMQKNFSRSMQKKPIALVGLNPHASDGGLIGQEDILLRELVIKLSGQGINIVGPIVPDCAFLKENWKKYSVYVSPYHDQGLIPFKMAHGFDSGVHITLGLPILRTSVDHGTAKDIFGKNKANENSMLFAIKLALRLTR